MWDEPEDDAAYAEVDGGSKMAAWLIVGFYGLIFLANVTFLWAVG